MPSAAQLNWPAPDTQREEARAFAASVAGVIDRLQRQAPPWYPGTVAEPCPADLSAALQELGWDSLARDQSLLALAGPAAAQLGARLAPLEPIDALLGASPLAGDLARSLGSPPLVAVLDCSAPTHRPVLRHRACPSAEGVRLDRVLELGPARQLQPRAWSSALAAWLAASVGYLAGLGQGALELTVTHVRSRRAFGSTLGALGPVQQLLAQATTAVRGVQLLAEAPAGPEPLAGREALAHAGEAIVGATAACQQVTGAIGFTLEYPLHRFAQRARALATFNEALLDCLPTAAAARMQADGGRRPACRCRRAEAVDR